MSAPRAAEPLAHFLAGLEEWHALAIDRNVGAGARVAAGACGPMLDRKGAEAPQLHPVAARERVDDFAEDRVDDVLHVALIGVRVLRRDALNEFGLDHRQCRPHERLPRAGLKRGPTALSRSVTGRRVPKGQ